jgi:Cu(I)/Ag(I) efflux system membrane fusion protein
MKKTIFIAFFATGMVLFSMCKSNPAKTENQTEMQKANTMEYYTCTMHPEVHLDKPGDCPKCGMKLVKAEMNTSDSTDMEHTMGAQ